jgi:hypothetical protein
MISARRGPPVHLEELLLDEKAIREEGDDQRRLHNDDCQFRAWLGGNDTCHRKRGTRGHRKNGN